jgi:hypothetical protein
VVLGGTGLRLFFVLGAGLVLTGAVPYFQLQSFWVWVLVFYLFTLALEMLLAIRSLTLLERRRAADTGRRGVLTP